MSRSLPLSRLAQFIDESRSRFRRAVFGNMASAGTRAEVESAAAAVSGSDEPWYDRATALKKYHRKRRVRNAMARESRRRNR